MKDLNVKIQKLENGSYSATITKGNGKDGIIKNRRTVNELLIEISLSVQAYYKK